MAVTRKTTARKTTATTKAKATPVESTEVEVQEEVKAVVAEAPKTKPETRVKKRLEINRDDLIECRSAVSNLVYVSKRTSEKFEWKEYGDVNYITLGELITMKSTQPRMLKEGWLIVDDEEAIEQLGLAKMYGNLFEIDDIDEFFALSEKEIKRILTNMPRGFKNSLGNFARERIQSGVIDSNRKIKLLEELLDVDLKIFE